LTNTGPCFSLLDEKAIAAAELRNDPCDFAFVDQAIDPKHKGDVLSDAPDIPCHGTYAKPHMRFDPRFQAAMGGQVQCRHAQVCSAHVPRLDIFKMSRISTEGIT